MKKFILMMAALIILTAPSYAQEKQETPKQQKTRLKAERRAQEEAAILKCLTDKDFKIIISRIYPLEASMQGSNITKVTSDGYYVKLKDDLFSCYLPYMGTSRTPIMGGQSLALEAKEQKINLIWEHDTKTDSYLYRFSYKNENVGDLWTCTIQVFTNGEANIRMDGNSRDAISYRGELNPLANAKNEEKQ
jgi:Domain of unknown function (DUF4251)